MSDRDKYEEFAKVNDTHYIHLGDNFDRYPCNSSIGPVQDDFRFSDNSGWECIGCHAWWPEMPDMEPEGLAALTRMRVDPQRGEG